MNRLILQAIQIAAIMAIIVGFPLSRKGNSLEVDGSYLQEYMNTDSVPTLAPGVMGESTADIQRFLAQTGDYTAPIDGIYGTESAQAVARFQARNGLESDGIVGIKTWKTIIEISTRSGEIYS
ncbi:MAG: peptidoglycan-binding domain-containing protein [Thainema sp.]